MLNELQLSCTPCTEVKLKKLATGICSYVVILSKSGILSERRNEP